MIGIKKLARICRPVLTRADGRALAVLSSSPFGVAVATLLLLITRSGDTFDHSVVPILWAGGAGMAAFAVYAGFRGRISDTQWAVYTALIMGLLTGLAVATNEPIAAEQLTSTLIFPPLMAAVFLRPRLVILYGMVAVALSWCVPLWAGQASPARLLGSALISVTITVATTFVAIMRSALDRARRQAESMAVTDQLTGLLNRRGMAAQFPALMATAARQDQLCVAMVVDVDHFKRINDSLGHQAGDRVLQQLATTIRSSIRPQDLAVRLGGEEFAVFMVVGHPGDGQLRAEHLRQSVADTPASGSAPLPAITISIGITYAAVRPEVLPSSLLDDLVNSADALLYEAKSAGRNCTRSRALPGAGSAAPALHRRQQITTSAHHPRRRESPQSPTTFLRISAQ